MAVAGVCSVVAGTCAASVKSDCPPALSQGYAAVAYAAETAGFDEARDDNGIFDLLSPELVKVYEENVAGKPVVSDLSPAKIRRMAQKYDCGEKKMCALVIVRDMAARAGGSVSLAELAGESDLALIKRAKQYVDVYTATLTDAEKKDLEAKFKAVLKGNPSLPFVR